MIYIIIRIFFETNFFCKFPSYEPIGMHTLGETCAVRLMDAEPWKMRTNFAIPLQVWSLTADCDGDEKSEFSNKN